MRACSRKRPTTLTTRDVVRQAGQAGAQAAGVAHDQLDLHARLRGAIERLDDVGVLERVHLEADQARLLGRVAGDLALDPLEQPLLQALGRDQELAVLARRLVAGGQIVEQLGQVVADRVVAGQQAEVGIDPRGAGVIVAGADVGVAPEPGVVAAHHQHDLGVGLEADHAVHDVDADLLQPARPLDVGGLVEARLDLDHDRDLLAVARRLDQVVDDPGAGRGAVERHLDRQHLGIAARLADEALDRGGEGFVRVLEQDRAGLADDVEDVAAVLERGVGDRMVDRIVQRRQVERRDLEQVAQAERAR